MKNNLPIKSSAIILILISIFSLLLISGLFIAPPSAKKEIRFTTQSIKFPPEQIDKLLSLSALYIQSTQYDQAIYAAEQAILLLEKQKEAGKRLAHAYNNLGEAYRLTKEYQTSLLAFEKSELILKQNFPSDYPKFARLYTNMGELYKNRKQYPQAIAYFEKALTIAKKHNIILDIIGSTQGIGDIYAFTNKNEKAIELFEKTLTMIQKELGENHPFVMSTFFKIGLCHKKLKHHDQAITYIEKANALSQKHFGQNNPYQKLFEKSLIDIQKSQKPQQQALIPNQLK